MTGAFKGKTVTWHDSGREPKHPPNLAYWNGIDLDLSAGAIRTCTVSLDWPAPRCGYYLVECQICGQRVIATTAGRVDDPRSITMACGVRT